MGRAYNETEKEEIRENLIKIGGELFATQEYKKTSVTELTKSVGIAQGSFYAFFESKESLFFEVLSREELEIGSAIEEKLNEIEMTRIGFKHFLVEIIDLIIGNPILKNVFREGAFHQMISKVPEDKYQNHLQSEYDLIANLVEELQKQKYMKPVKPEILSGLLHSLFLIQLHREEIGKDVFPEMFEFLVNLISDSLVNEGEKNISDNLEKWVP
jgi:AcrR family transcriptional regulator